MRQGPKTFIRKYRMLAGLSQKDVAERLGFTRAYINACEIREKCSRSLFNKFANIFGNVDGYTLMGYKIFNEMPVNDDEIRTVLSLLSTIAEDSGLKAGLTELCSQKKTEN